MSARSATSVSLHKIPPALDALLRQELFMMAPAPPVDLRRHGHVGPPLVVRRPSWWPVASAAVKDAR